MDVDLALAHVSKRFDGTMAVDDVSLEVRNGEFLSFLGPSGCGKTTTLRLIAGFEQPDEGDIRLKDRSVAGTPPNKRDVNTVFQHYALFPHLTVFDNIAYPLAIRKQPAQTIASRVQEMLGVVDLTGLDRRYPHQISGGQQQRVALARALINRPAVLLLDEPLGALDLLVRKRMQVELKRIQRGLGITFIYVTHDQEEALTLSDRIAVMNKGKIEQIGTPDEVYNHPATRFVLEFVGSTNLLAGTVIDVANDLTVRLDDGLTMQATGTAAVGTSVTVGVRPEKIVLGGGGANDYAGRIESQTFQGSLCHYAVRLDGGPVLSVLRQTVEGNVVQPVPSVGDRVRVSFDPKNALVFGGSS